jgi:hypothetical protein
LKEKTKRALALATIALMVCAAGVTVSNCATAIPMWISWAGSPGSGAAIKSVIVALLGWISWAGSPGSGAAIK